MERYGEQPTLPTHLHNDEWMIGIEEFGRRAVVFLEPKATGQGERWRDWLGVKSSWSFENTMHARLEGIWRQFKMIGR